MSEYQYYEFRAIDRRLSAEDQRALRALSTRATITATSFTNIYEWGDFRGDPDQMMDRYFDLFLYLANWGTRRLSMRLPIRIAEASGLMPELDRLDAAKVRRKGEHLVLDLWREEVEDDDFRDSAEWLGTLEPLRNAIMEGDPSIFYLAWLLAVDGGEIPDNAPEPAFGLGPMSPAIEAFAEFFGMDLDLVAAAAGTSEAKGKIPRKGVERYIRSLPDEEKVGLLLRVHDGEEPQLAAELRQRVRSFLAPPAPALRRLRSVGELRARAAKIAADRARKAEARAAAERKRQEQEEAAERERRLDELARRGKAIWRDIEQEIARRNERGYEGALALLKDLRALAARQGWSVEFARHLAGIRREHVQKKRFLERLSSAGML